MKKTKKFDFKKLALLGLTGGVMFSTEAVASDIINTSELLAFNGCGGAHGCNGGGVGSKGGSYQAYRNIPSQNSSYYSQPSSGCGAATPQYYQQNSAQQYYQQASDQQYYQQNSAPQYYQQNSAPQYYQQNAAPQYYQQNTAPQGQYYQASQGCGAISAPQGQQYHASQGCGAISAPQGQNNQPQHTMQAQAPAASTAANHDNIYTQWETNGHTADNGRYNTQSGSAIKTAPNSTINNQPAATTRTSTTTTTTTKRALTETELLSQLNEQGKTTYRNLDTAGKAIALKLAAESNYKDKNDAVEAARKMAEKRMTPASPK